MPLDAGYADQPYLLLLPDGSWFCTVTSAIGAEGDRSQGVYSLRRENQDESWTLPVPLEAPGSPENSYSVPLVTPAGRIYVFYNFNTRNQRLVRREDGREEFRVDCLGDYVFRYSDDLGVSWSNRHVVPVREFLCDRNNIYGGKVRFFWNVGKPCVRSTGEVIIPLHKVGAMGNGFFAQSEGAFILCSNLLTESDPSKLQWETLPDGEIGLTVPAGGGRNAEEHSLVELSDGSLFTVYRTVDGYPACSYSRDGGRTWEKPAYLRKCRGGRLLKNPRAANFVWKLSEGRYLYWFHNHGGPFIRHLDGHASLPNGLFPVAGRSPYDDRNPVWLCGGMEQDGPDGKELVWSEPEVFLYEDDPFVRMSYPDCLEQEGRVWISETNKSAARIHEVAPDFLQKLFGGLQGVLPRPEDGFTVQLNRHVCDFPTLPKFLDRDYSSMSHGRKDLRTGFSLLLDFDGHPAEGEVLLDTRNKEGAGIAMEILKDSVVEFRMCDGRTINTWCSDPYKLCSGALNHVGIIVDGGPKIISFVINGEFHDGGEERQFGWGRFSPNLWDVNGEERVLASTSLKGLNVFPRALMVSEIVACQEQTAAQSRSQEVVS